VLAAFLIKALVTSELRRMNKTVLITGTSKGIGFALANKFLENGFYVVGTSRPGGSHGIENKNFKGLKLDLAEFSTIELLKEKIESSQIKIDILVNNAAIGPDLDTLRPEKISFQQTFDVNVTGTTFLTESLINSMNDEGKIINISSILGSIDLCEKFDSVAYCMSKTALNMYTKILSNRLGDKIKVAAVHPGWVKTTIAERNITDARLSTRESATALYDFIIRDFKSGVFWDVESDREMKW
jgi:NAD(P)-dependent dehydrogenase (short-subunit alcohol dehydrogenase family)